MLKNFLREKLWIYYIMCVCDVVETCQLSPTPIFFFLGNQLDPVSQLLLYLSVATGLSLTNWMVMELVCATCRFGSLNFPMHSSLLSTVASFMHLHMWPCKLPVEDDGTKRWREPRFLKHHLEKSHPPTSDVGNGWGSELTANKEFLSLVQKDGFLNAQGQDLWTERAALGSWGVVRLYTFQLGGG